MSLSRFADSTYKVCGMVVVGSVDNICRRDKGIRRDRRAEEPGGDVTGGREAQREVRSA